MAKVKVGGANGLIDKLITLVGWQANAAPGVPQRVDALNAIDICEKWISQMDGLSYLRTRGAITLAIGAQVSTAPANPSMDFGLDFVIEMPNGYGKVEVLPADEFAAVQTTAPYNRADLAPETAMHAIDPADGLMKFYWRRANTTGGLLTYPITFHQVVTSLVDDIVGAGSVSLLPEGYELSLLLPAAEQFIKMRKSFPNIEMLTKSMEQTLQLLYTKYRTNKKTPVTDTNKERRKTEVDDLEPFGR